MAFKVVTTEAAWSGFMRRAKKAFPKEHVEALFGVATVDSFRITEFKKLSSSATKSKLECTDATEIQALTVRAKKEGNEFLGTIHTHPSAEYDTAASTTDHHDGVRAGERIMGIVVLDKKGRKFTSDIEWWFPQPKITFELLDE